MRTFSIELTQTLEWLTWLLGLSSLDSGPAIGSRPMTAIGAERKLILDIPGFRFCPRSRHSSCADVAAELVKSGP